MSGYELTAELNAKLAECGAAINQWRADGKERARAEAEYRKVLAAKMLSLKADGVPATLVRDVARGDRDVADAKFAAECADALYEAAREVVLLRKREADVIREQMQREWQAAGWRNV